MIALPMVGSGGAALMPGTYPGPMYDPVTIPTATPYAVPAPSTMQPAQLAPAPHEVPLNAYVSDITPTAGVAPVIAKATDPCGCGARSLKWYEVASIAALLVMAFAALRKS